MQGFAQQAKASQARKQQTGQNIRSNFEEVPVLSKTHSPVVLPPRTWFRRKNQATLVGSPITGFSSEKSVDKSAHRFILGSGGT